MKRIKVHQLFLLACAVISFLLQPALVRAEKCANWTAKAVSVQGVVDVKRGGDTQWVPVKLQDTFCPGDVVRVQKRSRADLALVNQPVLHLDQNTVMTIGGMKDQKTSLVELVTGAAHFFSRVTRGLEVRTTFVNAGVEGTEFFIRVDEDKATLSIFEGKVVASNSAGTLAITGGQSAIAAAGKAPIPHVIVRPRDAVQWALYYPPVIFYRPDDFPSADPADWQSMVRKSLVSYWKGDIAGAFADLEGAPSEVRDARFYTFRASLLLTVGRIDEASSDITKAFAIDPNNSNACALQSVIAVTRNDKEQALSFAKKAMEADKGSANALVAMSYAQQASFDLNGAMASAENAVKLAPENALAWARLAELYLSCGKRKEALKAAEEATARNPDLSRTQTVLGFAFLSRTQTGKAAAAFNKAIMLDSADPLARLGLGLAMIREGKLAEGGREIEIAASLDPNNALIRSYLGKTYFEEKRDKQAADELEMAGQFDPKDPTPSFYRAILKQTTSRPGEALSDLQQAVEQNDNRAVYRSRLYLDADLAARNASLARIYSDLGFQQRALVEGWASESADPADFSGHRFLADTYAALPRHEIARVSELLQSQLLQPLNISPIQPHLAESSQLVVSGAGPADVSANEFNSLFNRDGISVLANGIAGGSGTTGEEIAISGVYKNMSLSVGQFQSKTDGFRENSDIKDNIYNAFAQASLTSTTNVQVEYRYRKTENGDLALRYYQEASPAPTPEGFFPNPGYYPKLRQTVETNSTRIGIRYTLSPGSDFIGNYLHQNLSASRHDEPDPFFFIGQDIKTDGESSSYELQHLFRSTSLKTVVGAGYFAIDRKDNENDVLLVDPVTPVIVEVPSTMDERIDHRNFYGYAYIQIPKSVMVAIGGSYESRGDKTSYTDPTNPNVEKDRVTRQFNPKIGITWNPVPDTTFRAAYFRVLKRSLITNQTLEPTQVAGFNQFFDDVDATDGKTRGIGVDQKFSKHFYGGLEYSLRDLVIPYEYQFFDMATGAIQAIETREASWDERLARAYLYWIPQDQWTFSAEYVNEQFDRADRAEEFSLGARSVETDRVPLGVRYFHASGLSAMVKATYFDQKGEFPGVDPATGSSVFIAGKDRFWLIDAAVTYRLPWRHGLFTVGGKNLLDRTFRYFDTDLNNPEIQPKRFLYARATLMF